MSNLSKHIEQYFSIPYQEKAQREALIIKIMQTYGTPLNIIDAAGNPHYNLPMPMQDAPPNDRVQYYLFGLSQGADIPKEHLDSVIQGIQSIVEQIVPLPFPSLIHGLSQLVMKKCIVSLNHSTFDLLRCWRIHVNVVLLHKIHDIAVPELLALIARHV